LLEAATGPLAPIDKQVLEADGSGRITKERVPYFTNDVFGDAILSSGDRNYERRLLESLAEENKAPPFL
jgi:hypothetical protein